ncbi:hypothetical protein LG201_10325 [Methylobacillus gramineus]|uniref:PP0621 family protein n=1 Tax=Methylobacillus gramineus TaxID=755169 RepID=UPI001CFFFCAB|nr:PP0621 family protein [Methylobacillus gramineus]MCB5185598.1 hypothetical protein [Methylobacillus gramineus]
MAKLLLIAIVFWLLLTILKRYRSNMNKQADKPPAAEDMVQCAYCQVHLPRSESITHHQTQYCCEAHRKAHENT